MWNNRKSNSEWRNPIRPVEKKDGTVRICTNLMAENEIVLKDEQLVPNMNDIIGNMQGENLFIVIDLKDGKFQIKVAEKM